MFCPWTIWRNGTSKSENLFAWVVESQCYHWIYLLLFQDVPVILLVWIPLSVPLVGELASVTQKLAHALVCPMSQGRPVTVVLTGTGTWYLAEDVSHVTVTPGPLVVATVTRQDTLTFLSSSCLFPAPFLESAISSRSTGSFCWGMVLETKIWAPDDCACFMCSPAPLHSSCLQAPTVEQAAISPHGCLTSWFLRNS